MPIIVYCCSNRQLVSQWYVRTFYCKTDHRMLANMISVGVRVGRSLTRRGISKAWECNRGCGARGDTKGVGRVGKRPILISHSIPFTNDSYRGSEWYWSRDRKALLYNYHDFSPIPSNQFKKACCYVYSPKYGRPKRKEVDFAVLFYFSRFGP